MIINSHIITYLVSSLFSLLIGLAAAWYGFRIGRKWDINNSHEEQYRLEKKVYFIITIVSLGFLWRLLMIPLWFWTLHSMIISIPGAMCLVGVHNINAPFSYLASGLKLVLPMLYTYWLILNYLDRQVATQPFLRQKLILLAPFGVLILLETVLDISLLFSTPPRQVSCCTSLFDLPGENIPPLVSRSTWVWLITFYGMAIFILGEMIYFFISQKRSVFPGRGWWFGKKTVMFGQTLAFSLIMLVFILALHTKISPLFLHLPFHHCVFCLGQEVWDAPLFFSMIFIGLTLFMIYFWVSCLDDYREANPALGDKMLWILKWSTWMLSGGMVVLSVHLILIF